MKKWLFSFLNSFGLLNGQNDFPELEQQSIYDFTMKTLYGKDKSLADYKGQVLVIVNVASKCGLTPQYKDLEETFQRYKEKNFMVLGFPANEFLSQEPGSDEEIASFCQVNYGVSFDMFSKIVVKGPEMHPFYQFLTQKKYNQLEDADIKWNFQKFIFDKHGKLIKVVPPREQINSEDNLKLIEKLLSE